MVNPVTATLNGIPAPVTFAGLAPDFAGLYQVNVTIPPGAGRGRATLVLSASGTLSNPVDVVLP